MVQLCRFPSGRSTEDVRPRAPTARGASPARRRELGLVLAPCPLSACPYAHPCTPSSPLPSECEAPWLNTRPPAGPAPSWQAAFSPPAHVHREEEGAARCSVGWGQMFFDLFPRYVLFFCLFVGFFSTPDFEANAFVFQALLIYFFFLIRAHSYGWKGTRGNGKERAQQKEKMN